MDYNNNFSDVPRLSRKSPICWQNLPLLQDHIHQYCNTYIPNAVIILPNWLSKYPTNYHKHLGLEILQVQSMRYTHNGKLGVPRAGLAKHSLITPLSIKLPFHSAKSLLHPYLLKFNSLYYKMLQKYGYYKYIYNNLEQTVSK